MGFVGLSLFLLKKHENSLSMAVFHLAFLAREGRKWLPRGGGNATRKLELLFFRIERERRRERDGRGRWWKDALSPKSGGMARMRRKKSLFSGTPTLKLA